MAATLFTRPNQVAPVVPLVPGLEPHRFHMRAGGDVVWVSEWGEGPTVLLVHGWNGHTGQMTGFVRPLVEAGYHVVAFDLPGHGGALARHVNILDLRDATLAVAERMQTVHAVIAHSLGATATVLALSRDLTVERAVLIAPPAEVPHFVRRFASFLGLPESRVPGMLSLIRAELGGDLDSLDLRHVAPTLTTRALVLHDRDDREVPFAHGAALAAGWPGALLHPVEGLGHRAILRDETVIADATRFVTTRVR